MQNSSHHQQPVSIYGEFGVPMDYELSPLDPGLPTDHILSPTDHVLSPIHHALSPADPPVLSTFGYLPPPSDNLPPPAEELYSDVPEPVPDYHDEDSNEFPPPPPPIVPDNPPAPLPPSPGADATSDSPAIIGVRNGAVSSPEDEGELIQPRKLVNPCLASRERQALHKELLLNYKLGKDVLQKPELNKILAKRKETQKRKEWEEMKANQRTSLELRLEEQANKLKEKEESDKMKTIEEDGTAPEFMQMHRRITSKTPTSPPT